MIMGQNYHALVSDDAKNTIEHAGHVTSNPELPLHAYFTLFLPYNQILMTDSGAVVNIIWLLNSVVTIVSKLITSSNLKPNSNPLCRHRTMVIKADRFAK